MASVQMQQALAVLMAELMKYQTKQGIESAPDIGPPKPGNVALGACVAASGSGDGKGTLGVEEKAGRSESPGGEKKEDVVVTPGVGGAGDEGVQGWADEVISSGASDGSVEMPGSRIVVGDGVKDIKFGGTSDVYGDEGVRIQVSDGFMKSYVKTARITAFRMFVEQRAKCRIPKSAMAQFALCSYAAGSIPAEFVDGKRKLKAFESIGDLAITMHVAVRAAVRGENVESAQYIRGRMASNPMLSRIAKNSGLMNHVAYPSGIDVETAKTSADALEAVVGFLQMYRNAGAVSAFLDSMQL